MPESICFCGHKLIDVNKLKYPILIKIEGVHAGNGKALIQNKEELKEALNLLISESKNNILQEYLDVIRDYRVLVLKDNVIDSVIRKSENWKKNTSSEPEPVHFKIPELERLSIKAARCLGLDLAGVDVLETPDGYFVIEVNPEPGIEYFGDKAYKAVVDYIVENEKRQKIHQEAC